MTPAGPIGPELLLALYGGEREQAPWATFLERLKQSCSADEAVLWFAQDEGLPSEGRAWRTASIENSATLPDRANTMRLERVYALDELVETPLGAPQDPELFARVIRVSEPGAWSAWLAVFRARGDLSAANSALLSALSGHLFVAMSNFAHLEQARLQAAIAEDLLSRANFEWRSFDKHGRIVAAHSKLAHQLAKPATDAEKTAARLAQVASNSDGPSAVRDLHQGALIAIPSKAGAAASITTVVTRRAAAHRTHFAAMLEQLYSLSPQEARLAVALARGKTLIEAAPELGLTIETARNYSKRIFAKTGTRGQADLVRLALESVAMLA